MLGWFLAAAETGELGLIVKRGEKNKRRLGIIEPAIHKRQDEG